MSNMKKFIFCLIFSSSCFYPLLSEDIYAGTTALFDADNSTGLTAFPTLQIPMGGKYEGMGTAYTAVAGDSSFLESNPAASAVLEFTELAFFHNNWIADSNLEGVVFTTRFNQLGIGFGGKFLYVPFTAYNDWGERDSKGYYSETIGAVNISYNFFSSYSFYGLAVGANIKGAYRHLPAEIHPHQSAIAGMADIGLLTRFNFLKFYSARTKNFSLGLVIKNLGPYVLGDPLPSEATAGIAFSPFKPLRLAVDFNYPFSFSSSYQAQDWNIAAGLDIEVTDFYSVQGGFHYRGSNPRLSLGSEIDTDPISYIINYTLDLTTQVGVPLDRFSVVAQLNLGDKGRGRKRNMVENLYFNGLEKYAQGKLTEAIIYWEKALELDPGYTPARTGIDLAKKSLELLKELREIQEVK